MSMIEFKDVEKYYGDFHALKDINLKVEAGETVVLLGPSGSGKSTLIRTVNGLEPVQEGQLIVNGQDLANPKTDMNRTRKNVGMVFQHFNLYANKTVLENIMLAPRLVLKRDEAENKKIAMELLEKVGLADKAEKMPSTLSGGQQQRIAIARALVNEPKVLLLDEPLGALDLKLRKEMQYELKRIQQEVGITFIYVTHDQEEALTMSDKIVIMKSGEIQQVGTPQEIYNEPVNKYVANFIGESNVISGVMIEDYKVKFDDQIFDCVDLV